MFFRLQYAHFWALILVSIIFSMRHVYHFHKFFQQAYLFWPARLFCTLEYTQVFLLKYTSMLTLKRCDLKNCLCLKNLNFCHFFVHKKKLFHKIDASTMVFIIKFYILQIFYKLSRQTT